MSKKFGTCRLEIVRCAIHMKLINQEGKLTDQRALYDVSCMTGSSEMVVYSGLGFIIHTHRVTGQHGFLVLKLNCIANIHSSYHY